MILRTSIGTQINSDYILKMEDAEFPNMGVYVTMSNGEKFKIYYPSTAEELAEFIRTHGGLTR